MIKKPLTLLYNEGMELFGAESFEITINGKIAMVTEHALGGQQVFRVDFTDGTAPLIVTRASTVHGKMWMSIPQGRLKEAGLAGHGITEYFKNKK